MKRRTHIPPLTYTTLLVRRSRKRVAKSEARVLGVCLRIEEEGMDSEGG